jgi:hypothetical protein
MCDEMNSDIAKYVTEVLDYNPRFSKLPRGGKELVYEALVSKADGMYVPFE